MKKLIVFIALFFISYLSIAQITLEPLLPQVGLFQKSQLWNIVAINSSQYPQQCYVVLSLQDRQSGAEVISATSATFTLEKGSKQLNVANLTPIQYTYFSFAGDKTNDFLSVGSYMACFKLIGVGHSTSEITEACVPFDVAPLSPPILILPADSSLLKASPALFSWQPPVPLTMFQQLHYELLIAEVYPGQRPEEAVELNAPFFMNLNVTGNVMNYTGAYPAFQEGKWYAWQVVAQDGQSYAAKTQVWDFKIDSALALAASIVDQTPFLKMGKGDGSVIETGVMPGSILKFSYFNETTDKSIMVQVVDMNTQATYQFKAHIKSGENLIKYDLSKIMTVQAGKVYQAQIINSRQEKWLTQFEIYTADSTKSTTN